MSKIPENTIKTIITDPNGAETLVKTADTFGASLKRSRLTTSQIRALFGEVRKIESQWELGEENHQLALRQLILLKPKMAYRARKERGTAVRDLVQVLDQALEEVVQEKDLEKQNGNFDRFVDFFEAILAYHQAYGGN